MRGPSLCAAVGLCCWFTLLPRGAVAQAGEEASSVLFSESFEDPRLLQRGWYDGGKFAIAGTRPFAGAGCIEYTWKAGDTAPANSPGIRHPIEATDTVGLRCYIRLSKDWGLLPHEQTLWIDELAVGKKRLGPVGAKN